VAELQQHHIVAVPLQLAQLPGARPGRILLITLNLHNRRQPLRLLGLVLRLLSRRLQRRWLLLWRLSRLPILLRW
jgi:hypothetical protein